MSTLYPLPSVRVMGWLSGNSRQGFQAAGSTLQLGFEAAKYLNRVGDTTTVDRYPCLESLKAQQNWKRLSIDFKALAGSAQLRVEGGIGLKPSISVGKFKIHAGGSLHIEKTFSMPLEHDSGQIVASAPPTTIKAEVDAGLQAGSFGGSVEKGIQAQEAGNGGVAISTYSEEPMSLGSASLGNDSVSFGGAVYTLDGGGGATLSFSKDAATNVWNDITALF